jgi:hypothetical protein
MPAVLPVSLNQIDYSGEATRTKFYGLAIDATNYAAVSADAAEMRLGIEGISLCNETSMTGSVVLHAASGTLPTSLYAQRELAMKVFYVDNVNGRKGDLTIPGPDMTLLTLTKDEVSLTTGTEMIALVAAINGHAFSRDGNAITVTGARIIGRNN